METEGRWSLVEPREGELKAKEPGQWSEVERQEQWLEAESKDVCIQAELVNGWPEVDPHHGEGGSGEDEGLMGGSRD